jgi:hypothetical protein
MIVCKPEQPFSKKELTPFGKVYPVTGSGKDQFTTLTERNTFLHSLQNDLTDCGASLQRKRKSAGPANDFAIGTAENTLSSSMHFIMPDINPGEKDNGSCPHDHEDRERILSRPAQKHVEPVKSQQSIDIQPLIVA